MLNKKICIGLFGLFLVTSLFAHGKSDVEDLSVDNLHSWQESFDLESRTTKKAEKFNIMVTATDLAGNAFVEGPFNLYIDPNSDLPICGITNPYENMRVVGNLNIVGTCIDDDAVSYVELVFDGDTEHPIRAEGREFWSYFLDTVNLPEGTHTIKATGYDINGLPSTPSEISWQLDRTQPITEVHDRTMGMLVSGKVDFKGTVSDGNGIKELYYSVDGGDSFKPVKISKTKDISSSTFNFTVDTNKFEDGPAVVWFKAYDYAGSVGSYAFLYFIDNTKPDVQIISPEPDQVMNGKFTVAGFAKDDIGVTKLSWTFGEQSGDFDLIPGNPYWTVTLDTIGSKDKSRKFTIHAVDRVNNVVEKTIIIPLNQEEDKPVVTISEPTAEKIFNGDDEEVYVRGFATDDEFVKSVVVQLDAEDPITLDSNGSFYYAFTKASSLSAGNHKITVTAIDENDVYGNPAVVTFASKGVAPTFEEYSIKRGKDIIPFENGMEIHSESGSSFVIKTASQIGLKEVRTEIHYGKNGVIDNAYELKNAASYEATFPIAPDFPKGVVSIKVVSTDSIDRVSETWSYLYITNTSVVKSPKTELIFTDSTIAEDGSIISNKEFPVTGFLMGENIESVELIPESDFATVEAKGNLIRLIPGPGVGSSEPTVVQVTTDRGNIIKSRPFVFKADTVLPSLDINDYSETLARDGKKGRITISGNVSCITGVGKLNYRVLGAQAEMKGGIINSMKILPSTDTFEKARFDENGNFSFVIDPSIYGSGMFVVEIVAESAGGNKTVKSVAFSTIPAIEEPEDGSKKPTPKAPVANWVEGLDVYGLVAYQGNLSQNVFVYHRADMAEGTNPLTLSLIGDDGKTLVSSKYNAVKNPTLDANIANIEGQTYFSGMPVVLDYGNGKTPRILQLYVDTGAVVNSVSYEITGDEVPGGDLMQKGAAKLIKPTDGSTRWVAEIPLANLPSRITNISMTVKTATLEKTVTGSFLVLRSNESYLVDDAEKIYTFTDPETKFDPSITSWVLSNGSKSYFYANLAAPVKAELVCEKEGLVLDKTDNGHLFTLYSKRDGNYENVQVRFTDRFGAVYETDIMNFLADSKSPEVHLLSPELNAWLNDSVTISGTATDDLGIRCVEYSLNNGASWTMFSNENAAGENALGVAFSDSVDLTKMQDGLIEINIRATDNAGHITQIRTACFKDTTPPKITVVQPLKLDVVNGETLIVFEAHDNGHVEKVEYFLEVVPTEEELESGEVIKDIKTEIPIQPLISTYIGIPSQPIDERMQFIFTDAAGNVTTKGAWDFKIDSQSDLPRAEIHVPEELQVITRDFTISGVIYDDDGDSKIWYKIDDEDYRLYADQPGTSFAINIPLVSMTDNEHTVSVYAVDINGVKGEEVTRTFRISLEEPKGGVDSPTIENSVRDVIEIKGHASDENGIGKVEISLDNGNSYNDAVGCEEWSYTVDTRAIPSGTQVVFLRITDNYGITGLYSSLINIDNTAPSISLELPLDDSVTTGDVFFSGYAYDDVEITKMTITVRNMDKTSEAISRSLKTDNIISEVISIESLDDGYYNILVTGEDMAGNKTNVSRNIHLNKTLPPAQVDILYPLNGEHKNGKFNIYGQASANISSDITSLRLYIDDKFIKETSLTFAGFFKFEITPSEPVETGEIDENGNPVRIVQSEMSDGVHEYRVDAVLANGQQVSSLPQTITYSCFGPWITLDNFSYGDFAINRPWFKGTAGYVVNPDEITAAKAKDAKKELKEAVSAKSIAHIEVSLDNGKTFRELSTDGKWQYRVENEDMPEGHHFLLVRATMNNGETAIDRFILQVDNTSPTVKLINPAKGGHYNQKMEVSGLSQDNVLLKDVVISLRKGDKSSYELPSFIQGLYVDFHFWGASLFDMGVGLTFFDDNVKLQFGWGQFTAAQREGASKILGIDYTNMRYGGDNILTGKLLANLSTIPFSYFFGRDWSWLYASFALGAQFSRFNETNSGRGQILSAVVGQLEFPRVQLHGRTTFSAFSFYTEGSLWFIPTDVQGSVDIKNLVPQIAIGVRANIF
ncbi:MAG: Ig-like domain-containing protein [Treponema sp.]|nr:Ig-like domain-containing protein [Treponema sp.]